MKLVRAPVVDGFSDTNGQDYGASRDGQEVGLPRRGTIWLSCVTQYSGDFEHIYVTFTVVVRCQFVLVFLFIIWSRCPP